MSDPFPSERVHDPEFEALVERLCLRPGMYVTPPSYATVCAYIGGFDAARSGGPLIGFHQWLVVRNDGGNNVAWQGLARETLALDPPDTSADEDDQRAIRALGHLLSEFFEYRRANGVTKVFHDYAKWLLRRLWYTGPLRQAGQRG